MLTNKIKSPLVHIGIFALFVAKSHTMLAQSRFSMSVDAAPVYEALRYTSPAEVAPVNLWGFRAGTSLHYRLAPRWSVSSGLWMEWNGARNAGIGSHSDLTSHYFKVPLLAHYRLTDKRLAPYFSAGLVWDEFKYSVYSNSKPRESITVFNVATKPQLKYLLGAGGKYQLNEHLAGIVQPTFIYGARSGGRSYQLSLQTQLLFQF